MVNPCLHHDTTTTVGGITFIKTIKITKNKTITVINRMKKIDRNNVLQCIIKLIETNLGVEGG